MWKKLTRREFLEMSAVGLAGGIAAPYLNIGRAWADAAPSGVFHRDPPAGPVFKEVGSWALNHLRISPNPSLLSNIKIQSAHAHVKPEKAAASQISPETALPLPYAIQAAQLPDFTGLGMREVLKRSRALGLKVCLEGSGLAIRQNPEPGSPLKTVQSVKVNFKPPM